MKSSSTTNLRESTIQMSVLRSFASGFAAIYYPLSFDNKAAISMLLSSLTPKDSAIRSFVGSNFKGSIVLVIWGL